MITKSKLGAIAFISAIGLASGFASPVLAASCGSQYSTGCNGGGSAGYNHSVATDYRLKHHQVHHDVHQPSTTDVTK
jgi:hypothetical protein